MQLTEALCYAILTITATATCVKAEHRKHELADRRFDRRLSRRDAAVIIDNSPVDAILKSNIQNPNIIYRKLSRQKYGPPKPRYGPPRPKYGPPKPGRTRRPGKKNRGKHTSTKYGPPRPKKRSPKPKRRPSQRPNSWSMYGPPNMNPQYSHYAPMAMPVGYGEPPSEYIPDYQPPKQNYAEPPVDSYGAPLKAIHEVYPPAQSFLDSPNNFESQKYNFVNDNEQEDWNNQKYNSGNKYQDDWKSFQNEQNDNHYAYSKKKPKDDWNSFQSEQNDNQYAYSKKKPSFAKPDPTIFVTPLPDDEDNDNFDSYSENYNHRQKGNDEDSFYHKKKKPQNFRENSKLVNKPWQPQKGKSEYDDEIIVGGQYAEPPARHVPKFTPSAPMYNDDEDDDDFAPVQRYADSEVAASATISPYVNYKNSNMAFSPQNLNDVFSLVDK